MKKTDARGQQSLSDYQLKEVNVRLVLGEGAALYSTEPLSSPREAISVMGEMLKGLDREMCCVINVDNHLKPINYNIVSIGGIDSSLVPIQNVFKSAILSNAKSVIMMHNHPSGNITPSKEDINITRRLTEAGKLMDVPILDHVIIAGVSGNYFSFRDHYPEMFEDKIDMDFIKQMTKEGVADASQEYGGKQMGKMNFEEFTEFMRDEIKDFLPDEYQDANIMVSEIHKQGKSYTGITLADDDHTTMPVINLNQFYEKYENGDTTDKILYEMSEIIERQTPDVNMELFTDYSQAKDNLFIRVCNPEKNADYLEGKPFSAREDLVVTYHIRLDVSVDGAGIASTPVTDQMLKMFGVSPQQLHDDAVANSEKIMPAQFTSMMKLMTGMEPDPDDPQMMVLTNEHAINGAAAMFYEGQLDSVAEQMGGNVFILPSSIHEVIILPDNGEFQVAELESMVKSINATQVAPDEQLSDRVYHYDATDRVFELASNFESRMQEKAKEALKEKKQEAKREPEKKPSLMARLEEKKVEAAAMSTNKQTQHRAAEAAL